MAFWFFAVQAALLCGASSLLARDHRTSVPIGRSAVLPLLALVGASSSIAEAGVAGGLVLPVLLCSGGLVLLAFAGWADRRSAQRLLPAQALAVRHPIGAGLLTVFALSIATTGFWAYGPLLLKILFGTRPLISGYILAGEGRWPPGAWPRWWSRASPLRPERR